MNKKITKFVVSINILWIFSNLALASPGISAASDPDRIEALSASLKKALAIPYKVYDQTGTLVAEGIVDGPPVTLAQGFYRVTVRTSPPINFRKVELHGSQEVNIADAPTFHGSDLTKP